MASDTQHWNEIFSKRTDQELGWYEDDTSQTVKFIERVGLSASSVVFIPGAGTSALVDMLMETGCSLILNDISDEALKKLQNRVGSKNVEFLHHNMASRLPKHYQADLWIDRAVLHFLLDEQEISSYFQNLQATVKLGGYVLLAEFSKKGATMCAGLNIHQYSVKEMQSRLGHGFELISSEEYTFINPFGQEKPYVYGLFQRKSS